MKCEKGFTLMELLVAMFVAGIVMAGVYSAYYSQQRSFVVQDEVAKMQQNLRAAMFFMAREIRMAGCNPTGAADTGIKTNDADKIRFTMDLRGKDVDDPADGDTSDDDEDITYSLVGSDLFRDAAKPGPIAENIDWLHFAYLDENGAVTASAMQVRSVQITIVARTGRGVPGYVNNERYYDLQGVDFYDAPGDNNRRKKLSTNIKCRNLGLL